MLTKLIKNITLLLLLSLFSYQLANSQEGFLDDFLDASKTFGLYSDLNFNNHFVDFAKFNGYPLCCTKFDYAFGLGLNIGVLTNFNLINNSFDFQFRLGINQLSGLFEEVEPKVFGILGEPVFGNITYTIDTKITLLDFSILTKREILNNLDLLGGIKIGIPIQSTFQQQEEISHGVFQDTKSKFRNKKSDDIPDFASALVFLSLGSTYNFTFGKDSNFVISPEIFLDFGLHNLLNDSSWYLLSPKLGVSFTYIPKLDEPEKIEYKFENKIDTLIIAKPMLLLSELTLGKEISSLDSFQTENFKTIINTTKRTDTLFIPRKYNLQAAIRAVGVDDGIEKQIVTMEIKEFQYFSMRPLLNYLFFDYNSATIPERYHLLDKEQADKFELTNTYNLQTLETYYHILNIIGYRLKNNPDSKITVVGCNSDTDEEKKNMNLSTDRAYSVADYLINIWNVSPNRIKIRTRNLPEQLSPIDQRDGIEENRRVEIYSDDYEIIEPVFINDTLRVTTPSDIRFYPEIIAEAGLKNWTIKAIQNDIVFKEFKGNNQLPSFLDWSIDLEKETIPVFNDALNYYIEVEDSVNNTFKSSNDSILLKQIKIEKSKNRVGDKKIEHFSLILFDFDDTSLNESNQKIKDYIKTKISKNSIVKIAGYTDRLGDAVYNEKLSKNRAITLAKELDLPIEFTAGIGESTLLYDNELPEGRFYCRTVEVIIETPILENE